MYQNWCSVTVNNRKRYKEDCKIAKAIYYLNRFDNLVSGSDDLYETFENEDGWAMERLLLTISRFCTLVQHISTLPDFAGFEKLAEIIDYFSKGLYGELDADGADDIEEELEHYDALLDDAFDFRLMCDYTQKIEIPNQPSFIPADLECGNIGTYFFSTAYAALQSFIFHEPNGNFEMEFVACGILADNYYRTSDSDLRDMPNILEETERIFLDYDFVKSNPTLDKFQERINAYKRIMLV